MSQPAKRGAMPRRERKRPLFKLDPLVLTKKRKRWVLGEGHICNDITDRSISLWNEWGDFGPKEMLKLKMPKGRVMKTRYRLILEEIE